MMNIFLVTVLLAAIATQAEETISPLFLLSSTATLDITPIPNDSSVNEVHHAFYGAVSSCPTKNYAVVHQFGALTCDYDSNYLPIGVHAHTNLIIENVRGTPDVVAIVNTILMDCLHAPNGVKRVESLDTRNLEVADIDEEVIAKSIVHISLPELPIGMGKTQRAATLARNDEYIKTVIRNYFYNNDYTLIYITQAPESTVDETKSFFDSNTGVVEGAEVPFVFEDKE